MTPDAENVPPILLSDETHLLRLLLFVALNAAVLIVSTFTARRTADTPVRRAIDALLLFHLLSYLAVTLAGVTGLLTSAGLAGATAVVCVVTSGYVWFCDTSHRILLVKPARVRPLAVGAITVTAVLTSLSIGVWTIPPFNTDALTYHLPASVEWVRGGRIGVDTMHEPWFFNPANAYSPLAGSVWMTWSMLPLGHDAFARFVQIPAVLLMYVASYAIARRLGAVPTVAALLGIAVTLTRPVLSQAATPKDDLFVMAFLLIAVATLLDRTKDRLRPWRLGVTLGLLLATKYTALLALPALAAVAISVWVRPHPFRWGTVAIVTGVTLVLAGPWYGRNLLAYGNPVYPLAVAGLPGLFTTAAAEGLRSIRGVLDAVVSHDAGTTMPYGLALMIAWLGGLVTITSRAATDGPSAFRVRRRWAVLLAPVIGLAMFFAFSPYAEVRFIYGSLGLMALSVAVWPRKWALPAAATLAGVAVVTAFRPTVWVGLLPGVVVAFGVGWAAVCAGRYLGPPWPRRLFLAGSTLAGLAAYVVWPALVGRYRLDTDHAWATTNAYGLGDVWAFVRNDLPPDATIAYHGTHLTYPLYGFLWDRDVLHVPLSQGVRRMSDLPFVDHLLPGERIAPAVAATASRPFDSQDWLARLGAAGVRYLLIVHDGTFPDAGALLTYVQTRDDVFVPVFERSDVTVFAVRERSPPGLDV